MPSISRPSNPITSRNDCPVNPKTRGTQRGDRDRPRLEYWPNPLPRTGRRHLDDQGEDDPRVEVGHSLAVAPQARRRS